jgi:hypothetical protein
MSDVTAHDLWLKIGEVDLRLEQIRAEVRRTSDRHELEALADEERALLRRKTLLVERHAYLASREGVDVVSPPAAMVQRKSVGPFGGVFRGRLAPILHHNRRFAN